MEKLRRSVSSAQSSSPNRRVPAAIGRQANTPLPPGTGRASNNGYPSSGGGGVRPDETAVAAISTLFTLILQLACDATVQEARHVHAVGDGEFLPVLAPDA